MIAAASNAPLLLPMPRCEHCGVSGPGLVSLVGSSFNYQRAPTGYEIKAMRRRARELLGLKMLGANVSEFALLDCMVMSIYDEVANRARLLCEDCGDELRDNETEQWSAYYSGLL